MNVFDAFVLPQYFGRDFRDPSWNPWKTVLKACCGLELTPDERAFFRSITQRDPLAEGFTEVYAVCGRRSGKSRVAAAYLCAHALVGTHGEGLAAGERAYGFIFATDRLQASVAFGYAKGFLERFPDLVERITADQIDLKNNCSIMVKTSDFRSSRGFATFGIVLDELAFFPTDKSASPASELIEALQYSMLEDGFIWGTSSPYARMGYLWDVFKNNYGNEQSPILVVQAGTTTLNPSYSQGLLSRLRLKRSSSVELDAQFRDDVSPFIDQDTLSRYTTMPDATPRKEGYTYIAFLDPSGGSGQDSMTLAIAHAEEVGICIDRVEEFTPPFSPEDVAQVFSEIIKNQYGCLLTYSDRFGGEWVRERFRQVGIPVDLAPLPASELYHEFNFLLRAGVVRLPKHEKMTRQFCTLERKARSGGRDSITHSPGGHDDISNAVAGACVCVKKRYQKLSPEEMEARMPVKTEHRVKSRIGFAIADERERQELKMANHEIMHDLMSEGGKNSPSNINFHYELLRCRRHQ